MNTQATRPPHHIWPILLLALTIFLGLGIGLVWLFFLDAESIPAANETAAPTVQAITTAPPDLRSLATAALNSGGALPNSEQEEAEYQQIVERQVSFASELLQNPDAEQRAIGAEQLSAYPTEAAEQQLTHALLTDIAAEVRAMAAQSLGRIKKPKDESIDALLSGMLDTDGNASRNAFNSLQNYLRHAPDGSPQIKKIIDTLATLAKSSKVQADTRNAIRIFLADQVTGSPKSIRRHGR